MENKLIEVQDLQVGDEIMISCQSYFKYLRVLTPPTMSKTKTNWQTKNHRMSTLDVLLDKKKC